MNTLLLGLAQIGTRPGPIQWVNLRRGGLAAFDATGALVVMLQGRAR